MSGWSLLSNYPTDVNTIEKRLQDLENQVMPKLAELDNKLNKLIESHKSFIAYFSALNDRDVRDVNLRIRGFNGGKFPPMGFVPERSNTDI